MKPGALALVVVALAGCAAPPTRVPMDVTRVAGPCAGRAPALLVLLPGIQDRPQDFIDHGFVDELAQRRNAVDVWLADAHVGYYEERSIFTRLRQDVIEPARAAGYRKVWLVGISLGGFGAFGHSVRETPAVDGIVAIAPYPGAPALLQQIAAAGGVRAWQRLPPSSTPGEPLELDIWRWLAAPPAGAPTVFLAYGRDDRFAEGARLMAQTLTADHVLTTEGGHSWGPWRRLWSAWLDGGWLGTACNPS